MSIQGWRGHGARLRGAGANPQRGANPQIQPRLVQAAQLLWVDLAIPFTGSAGESVPAGTKTPNYDLIVKGGWTNVDQSRIRLVGQTADTPFSPFEVPILSLFGASRLSQPMRYWRRPYFLPAGANITANVINDGAQQAGDGVFLCERPGTSYDKIQPVNRSRIYQVPIALGLAGAGAIGGAESQAAEDPTLLWGATSTSTGALIQIRDNQNDIAWSSDKLPVGAFAGIDDGSLVQPIMYFSKPYLLGAQAQIVINWTNLGNESGKFFTFIGERVLPQTS